MRKMLPTLRRDTRRWLDENPNVFGEVMARLCGAWEEGVVDRPPSPWEVCRAMGLSYGGLLKWVAEKEERTQEYERALRIRAHLLAEEIVEIADTPKLGVERKMRSDGSVETTENDMLGHRRLQIEARKFIASKWDGQRYGDKVEHAVTGGVTVEIVRFGTGQVEEKVVEPLPDTPSQVEL